MPELLNWPPSRGPNPHTHEWTLISDVTRKELPAPKMREGTLVEKKLCEDLLVGKLPEGHWRPPKKAIKRSMKKPLLEGSWKVWYQVETVAKLTLEQADNLVMACQEDGKASLREHVDTWLRYEPRPLWVDLTYPLTRGVRLLVKPCVRASSPCKACEAKCGPEKQDRRFFMSPGYFLWVIAKEYEHIYAEHERYGVWGHGIGDLGFERITIRKDGVVDLFIGS